MTTPAVIETMFLLHRSHQQEFRSMLHRGLPLIFARFQTAVALVKSLFGQKQPLHSSR